MAKGDSILPLTVGGLIADRETGEISWSPGLNGDFSHIQWNDLTRETLLEVSLPEDHPAVVSWYADRERGEEGTLRFHVNDDRGQSRLLRVEPCDLPQDAFPGKQLYVVYDLTRYRDTLLDLRKNERLLLHSLRSADLGYWSLDLKTMALEWSPEIYQLCGLRPGTPPSVMLFHALVHPEDRDWVERDAAQALLGTQVAPREYRIIRRNDGELRWVQEWCSPVKNDAGDLVLYIGTLQDVTGRKSLERELASSQRMEAVGRLASGIAHDFNNMLTVITGYVELLEEQDDSEELAKIADATRQASALTAQLLAFSRQQLQRTEIFDLNASIHAAVRLVERIIGEHIMIVVEPAPVAALVRADRSHIDQVIMNLLLNARDAMPDGGVLTIRATITRRKSDGDDVQRYVQVTVSDTGIGMDEETCARVFEPYFTTKRTGNGLGLATVYGTMMQLGGAIELNSEPGVGTTFDLYFPRAETPEPSPPDAPEPIRRTVAPTTESGTVLVVEDECAIRDLLKLALERAGYRVHTAATPRQAMDIWTQIHEHIDLVITDMIMPEMNGPAMLQEMGACRAGKAVILMTGYAPASDELPPGVRVLQKPFAPAALMQAVAEALRAHKTLAR